MFSTTFTVYWLSVMIVFVTAKSFRIPLYPMQEWNVTSSSLNEDEGYYIALDIGNIPQRFNVLLDTGSSNLAIMASPNVHTDGYFHYNESKTFHTQKKEISVHYIVGSWNGTLATELISIPSIPPIHVNANIACIETEENIFPKSSKWQGLLGMAYGTIAEPTHLIPLFDSFVQNGKLSNIFSLAMCGPFATERGEIGELILGGIEDLYSGRIMFTPIFREWYYEVVLVDLKVGNKSWPDKCSKLNTNHTILDSGTSNLLLPKDVLSWLINEMKEKTKDLNISEDFWNRKDKVCLNNSEMINSFPDIKLSLAYNEEQMFSLLITAELYLQKRPNEENNNCYFFSIELATKGTILGAIVLKGYYIVFDRQNKQMGFANGSCTSLYDKLFSIVTEPEISTHEMADCVYLPNEYETSTCLKIAAYVITSICLICALPVLIMLLRWIWMHIISPRSDSSENSSLVEGN